jgi:hypothetical protein
VTSDNVIIKVNCWAFTNKVKDIPPLGDWKQECPGKSSQMCSRIKGRSQTKEYLCSCRWAPLSLWKLKKKNKKNLCFKRERKDWAKGKRIEGSN